MSRSDDLPADRSQLKADLVAYLDGELDADTARDLENLLATDPEAREEMQRMEQTWDLLDQLPRAEVDEAFTHSTIEMVAVSAAEEVALLENSVPRQRRRRLRAGVLALAASLGVGFVSVFAFWPNPNEQLLRDLPVLERLDQYRQVDSIDFLRRLAEKELLPTASVAALSEPTSLAERQMQIEQLSLDDKESLLRKQQRFAELPLDEQQRIRTLHAEIQQDPQASVLRGTLSAYYDWLLQQSAHHRPGLAALDAETRIARIEKLRKDEQQRELYRVSAADLEAIAGWLEEQVRMHLVRSEPPLRIRDLPALHRRGALMLVASQRLQPIIGASHLAADSEALKSLRRALSPQGQAKLDLLDSDDQRRRVLVGWDGWCHQAIRDSIKKYHDGLMADVQKEDLVQFFEELPPEERDDLQRHSSSESREMRLRSMYLRKYKSDQIPEFARDIPWWWMRGVPRGGSGMGSSRERDPNREGGPPPGPPRRGPNPDESRQVLPQRL